MAATLASHDKFGEDFATRLANLDLPERPLIMGKVDRPCPRHTGRCQCHCYEYITFMRRDEYEGKWLPESPEQQQETRTPRATNGVITAKKKLKLGEYMAKNNTPGGSKAERQRSAEPSPSRRQAAASTPPPPPPSASNAQTSNQSAKHVPAPSNHTNGKLPRDRERDVAPTPPVAPTPTPPHPPSAGQTSTKMSPPPPRKDATPTGSGTLRNGTKPDYSSLPRIPKIGLKRTPQDTPKNERDARDTSGKSSTRDRDPPPAKLPRKRQRTPSPDPPARMSRKSPPAQRQTTRPTKPNSSKSAIPQLPPLLSPTLPKYIEDALAAEEEPKVRKEKASDKAKATRETPDKPSKTTKAAGKKPVAATPSSSSAGKSLPKKSKDAATKTLAKRTDSPRPSSRTGGKTVGTQEKPTLLLKLRFTRCKREFAQYCKLSAGKRPRQTANADDDSGRAAKRPKGTATALGSKTGSTRPTAFKSPAVKTSHDRDSTPPPRKTNGAGLKRESKVVSTPSMSQVSRSDSRSSADDGFREDSNRFSKLGKEAKHEADAIFANPDNYSAEDIKHAFAAAVDGMLCFVLSFIIQDRLRKGENKGIHIDIWRSFIPLVQFVSDKAKLHKQPHVLGLCKLLEAVVREHIFNDDILNFGRMSIPEASTRAPTPDPNNTNNNNDGARYIRLKNFITRGHPELMECWVLGDKHLPEHVLDAKYPNTFNASQSKHVDAESLPREPGNYECQFRFPLRRSTSPIEALNFAKLFMEEWTNNHELKYRSRLHGVL